MQPNIVVQTTDVRSLPLLPRSDVRYLTPMSDDQPVHKPPRLELQLVSTKRLSDHPRRPTWRSRLTGREQCTEVTSHHNFLISVHVARSTTRTRCRLRFFVFDKPLKTPTLLHYFITPLSISQTFLILEMLSLPLRIPHPSNPKLFKGMLFSS